MFETIENKGISQKVIEQIQDMVMNGELKCGDKLPPERELTQKFNIGRPALREALKALEIIGLIESRHGQGNYIVNNTENSFFKPLSLSFKLSNGNLEEVLELRYLIENYTVKQSCIKANSNDIKKLYDLHNKMIEAESTELKSYYDKEFHYEIAKIGKNMLIDIVLESTSYLLKNFINKSVEISIFGDDSTEKIYEEHLNIIKAIENHDEKAAVEYMNNHLNKIDRNLLL